MNKDFGDKRQVGNPVWTLFLVFLASLLAWSLMDDAEAMMHPSLKINGEDWTEHVDSLDVPPLCASLIPWAGCYTRELKRIDYMSPIQPHTIDHERGHAAGMIHGEFEYGFDNSKCAPVLASGGKYHAGDTICITQAGERLIPASYFAEAK